MGLNFGKRIVVGVAVTPEIGIEIAQIDVERKLVLKYISKRLEYDVSRQVIADMDIFKDTLQELLTDLMIPKGSEIVLNVPASYFGIKDYPASFDLPQIKNAVEEELLDIPMFKENFPALSIDLLPNSNIQTTKCVIEVANKTMLIEIAMQIKELGYKLVGIDTSVNSTLNALIYNERVDVSPDISWVMLLVENNYCRIFSMQGCNYVDSFEEKISIGEVLGDAENYATIVNAVMPVLKNMPSQRLYVISKTNLISARILSDKLTYNAQIIHQEANAYLSEPFLAVDSTIPQEIATTISIDVIGAAIFRDFTAKNRLKLNLYNETLGDIYTLAQPPVIKVGNHLIVTSMENMLVIGIVFAMAILIPVFAITIFIKNDISQKNNEIASIESEIGEINKFLEENKGVSSDTFNESDEIRIGIQENKNIYSYYTIVGTEIPKKLWLTSLSLGKNITIQGQADNLESVYGFYRNIKDYNPSSAIKLQKLGLATKSGKLSDAISGEVDSKTFLTSLNADFYEFKISDAPEEVKSEEGSDSDSEKKDDNNKKDQGSKDNNKTDKLPPLEPINE